MASGRDGRFYTASILVRGPSAPPARRHREFGGDSRCAGGLWLRQVRADLVDGDVGTGALGELNAIVAGAAGQVLLVLAEFELRDFLRDETEVVARFIAGAEDRPFDHHLGDLRDEGPRNAVGNRSVLV